MPSANSGRPQMASFDIKDIARENSYDRYLRAVFAPVSQSHGLAALAAFFADVSRVPFAVEEPLAGEVRLQWWREALEGSQSRQRTGNPIADAMRTEIAKTPSLLAPALDLLEARRRELYPEPLQDQPALDRHIDLLARFEVAAHLVLVGGDVPDPHPHIQPAGRAIAISDIAQRLGGHVLYGRPLLPLSYFEGRIPQRCPLQERRALMASATTGLKAEADRQLTEFRAGKTAVLRTDLLAVLPVALVEPYFRALQSPGLDVLATAAELSPLRKMLQSAAALWLRRF